MELKGFYIRRWRNYVTGIIVKSHKIHCEYFPVERKYNGGKKRIKDNEPLQKRIGVTYKLYGR